MKNAGVGTAASLCLLAASSAVQAGEWSGYLGGELRYFPEKPFGRDQYEDANASLVFEPEYVHSWDAGDQVFAFVPFVRWDQHDPERTHFDIRELTWVKAADDWELRVGVRKVFWGVTEFLHLVDIINQDDLVESPDEEEKLGQPMINFAWIGEWGTLDLFVLTGFRERTFAGREGRLHGGVYVDADQARYESGAEEEHIDLALRWSKTFGDWDIGLYHFWGTSRDPRFEPGTNAGQPVLIPVYDIVNQIGLDVQYTGEEWLWKFEAITREGQGDAFFAATGGFEYTFVGLIDSAADLGFIGEYAYDSRGEDEAVFENDLMLGTRLSFNDVQSTELLAGIVFDLDSSGNFYSLEASRRIGQSWKLNVEARLNSDIAQDDPAFAIRNEDFVQLELQWFF